MAEINKLSVGKVLDKLRRNDTPEKSKVEQAEAKMQDPGKMAIADRNPRVANSAARQKRAKPVESGDPDGERSGSAACGDRPLEWNDGRERRRPDPAQRFEMIGCRRHAEEWKLFDG